MEILPTISEEQLSLMSTIECLTVTIRRHGKDLYSSEKSLEKSKLEAIEIQDAIDKCIVNMKSKETELLQARQNLFTSLQISIAQQKLDFNTQVPAELESLGRES